MAYMLVVAPCYRCEQPFSFSAERVPSVLVDGKREPLCRDCVEAINPLRKEKGLPEIVPLPGAYEADEVI